MTPAAQAPELTAPQQAAMAAALLAQLRVQNPGAATECIETHISFVLIAGARVYKLKKVVNLGFVDFTTLALRHHFCTEELRLNRRLAPDLYLDVLPVTGTPAQPALGGSGPVIDWAVSMRAFAQDDLWERLADRGALRAEHVDELVDLLCAFHQRAAVATPADGFGNAAQVRAPMTDTLRDLRAACRAPAEHDALQSLVRWEARAFDALQASFEQRLRDGHVRECHGDLHLGNVTLVEGRTTVFDGLEFSPALRWTDVVGDVAFMAMDLRRHGLPRLAHRFVNAWVERSGDHGGLSVLRYYEVYRALVRAKVAALHGARHGSAELQGYLDVALACNRPAAPVLFITHGLSGSGKSTWTQGLLEQCGAIRLRADVERKRLFGLPALARSDAAQSARLYSPQADAATHARLYALAERVLRSGFPVILDATFLAHARRQQARALAERLGCRFVLIDFRAGADTLRRRVVQRQGDASDADLAVLERQLATAQPLSPEEQAAAFVVVTDGDPPPAPHWETLFSRRDQ